jgi:hypothetical protein
VELKQLDLLLVDITPPTNTNATEEYSGYTWATGGNWDTARRTLAGAGTQTAGLSFWRIYNLLLLQQKNMTDLLGQLEEHLHL